MRKRFSEGEVKARKLAVKGDCPSLVSCLYCANGTNVHRIEAHTRKQHPDKGMPSYAPLASHGQANNPSDIIPQEVKSAFQNPRAKCGGTNRNDSTRQVLPV